MKKSILVLITEKFPYGKSETFLETEITYLADVFKSVLILPGKTGGKQRPLPANVTVDTRFSEYCATLDEKRVVQLLRGVPLLLSAAGYFRQAKKQPARYLHPTGFKRMAMWARYAELLKRFFEIYISEQNLDREEILFYTYWFHLSTVALGRSLKHALLVSRAHGFDLYDERGEPPYTNWKCLGLQNLDKLFLISEDGKNYMEQRYPEFSQKFRLSRLGVHDPGVLSKASEEGVFRLVSVASVREVKRIHLIVSAISILAEQRPDLTIRWDHFGDGPLMDNLILQVEEELAGKAKTVLHGMVPNSEVMEFYTTNPVDLFINVSSSEGIPISIMEAQSFGVPVMATDVGGTSEIVNSKNGVLLHQNPKPNEIAKEILKILENPKNLIELRKKSKQNWMQNFNAEINYKKFANDLIKL